MFLFLSPSLVLCTRSTLLFVFTYWHRLQSLHYHRGVFFFFLANSPTFQDSISTPLNNLATLIEHCSRHAAEMLYSCFEWKQVMQMTRRCEVLMLCRCVICPFLQCECTVEANATSKKKLKFHSLMWVDQASSNWSLSIGFYSGLHLNVLYLLMLDNFLNYFTK